MNQANPCEGEELQDTLEHSSLWSHVRFELRSWIGRQLFGRPPPALGTGDRLLNLGCGPTLFEGWVNADFFRFRVWRLPTSFWAVDLRYALNCPSGYWDGVYCEHTIEHLRPSQAHALFKEVFRTLKPGAWFRVSVPDLARYVRYYQGEPMDEAFGRWPLRAAAIRSVSQGWVHASVWDRELLIAALTFIGFEPVRAVDYRMGEDPRLLKDLPKRRWESLYIEARKPLV
jgi:SAM-dependent methyltransferase